MSSHAARIRIPKRFDDRPFFSHATTFWLSEYTATIFPSTKLWKQDKPTKQANISLLEMMSTSNIFSLDHGYAKNAFPQHPPIPHSNEASTKISRSNLGSFFITNSKGSPLLAARSFGSHS